MAGVGGCGWAAATVLLGAAEVEAAAGGAVAGEGGWAAAAVLLGAAEVEAAAATLPFHRKVGPGRYCPPRQSPRLRPSFLDLNGIT